MALTQPLFKDGKYLSSRHFGYLIIVMRFYSSKLTSVAPISNIPVNKSALKVTECSCYLCLVQSTYATKYILMIRPTQLTHEKKNPLSPVFAFFPKEHLSKKINFDAGGQYL